MTVLAIDPGPIETAWVLYSDEKLVIDAMIEGNESLRVRIETGQWLEHPDEMAIEMIASYGMPVGREVFETCVWIGRFIEVAKIPFTKVYRQEVKLALCGQPRAKDANIRQYLLDYYGPGKEKAVGTKKNPGPLYGFKADMWAALAVALYHTNKKAGIYG